MKIRPWVKITILTIIVVGVYSGYTYFKGNDIDTNTNNTKNESNDSKVIKFAKDNNIYDEKYINDYKEIIYSDKDNFKEILSIFLDKGYSGKEINYITKLSDKNIEKLKKKDYIDISNYYTLKNFDVDNIDRYNDYKNEKNYSYEDTVTYVNIKLDLPVYTDTAEVKDPNNLLVLVNKYNCLPNNYKPSDLAYEPGAYGDNVPMRELIQGPFQKLKEAAKKEANMNLMPSTAFRTQSLQTTLYNNYVNRDGKTAADTYSARPGCSEHQTGLAIDLRNVNLGTTGTRLTDENYKWLEENAYKYGFIIRFPKDKEFITGYIFENWHIRYVGLDIAKTIYENNLTLEEYIDLYVNEY